jgi:Fe-S-cluster-containing dehydrogenase component
MMLTFVWGAIRVKWHCPQPPCIKVCPTEAIKKRPDGIVFIDQSLCTGCQLCADACPYEAISFHPYQHWAEICDLCVNRLDEGLSPFCIQYCMSGALFFGTKDEFQQRKKIAAGGSK